MTKARYDRIAPHYDRSIQPLERWFLSELRRKVVGRFANGSRILELGAGTGLNFQYYPHAAHGAAIEPSQEMLQIARSKQRPGSVSLVQACAETLPFAANSFDGAFATLVFCSVDSPHQALAELTRVVKPGGLVVLLDHVRPKGLLGPIFDLLNLFTSRLFDDHFNRRTADEARASGLQVKEVENRLSGIINLIVCQVEKV